MKDNYIMEDTYRLCYVDNISYGDCLKLYFTNDMEHQWGDDWNDSPADCNAEAPYDYYTDEETGEKVQLSHKALVVLPDYIPNLDKFFYGGNSFSVEDLNNRIAPWVKYDKELLIFGGDTYTEVMDKLSKNDLFKIYVPYEDSPVIKIYIPKEDIPETTKK